MLGILSAVTVMMLSQVVFGQIPYSYTNGRDLDAVNRRFEQFRVAKASGASQEQLDGICGRRVPFNLLCPTRVGRSPDSETNECDSHCCHSGRKVGNCTPSGCQCFDDDVDIKCGQDGSFAGIRCPDSSACRRRCCRRGLSGGRCRGFLNLKCKCD